MSAGSLHAQTATEGAGSTAEEFRQQLPLGTVTGDAGTLRQRILSATSYRMTAGDTYELRIQLGSDPVNTFPLVLQDDYQLDIPYVGTVDVRGRLFSDSRREIVRRIKEQVPARFVSFVLKQPALFDVFIYGGVANPGIYTVTPLSRVSDLITIAGGPQQGSSLRRVELTRDDLTRTIDLTRFSTHGELDANPTLTPADRVRIPRAERLVSITGTVAFPGAFDLLAGEGVEDLIRFAGGLRGERSDTRLSVVRGRPVPQVVGLAPGQWRTFQLRRRVCLRVTTAPAHTPKRLWSVSGAAREACTSPADGAGRHPLAAGSVERTMSAEAIAIVGAAVGLLGVLLSLGSRIDALAADLSPKRTANGTPAPAPATPAETAP